MVSLTQNHPHINLRVKFKKVGSLQYISHLDLVRTMMKIITRAALPLWYTEGYNPKPKITFAAPLSIGTESVAEFMDIKLVDDMPTDEIVRRLNENMTDEMQVLDAYYTDVKLSLLKWLLYHIEITTDGASPELAELCASVLAADVVMVEKKPGKGSAEPRLADIKPAINSAEVNYVDSTGRITIDAILSADASSFLNPEYIIKALKEKAGILSSGNLTREYYSIMRLEGYRDNLTPFV